MKTLELNTIEFTNAELKDTVKLLIKEGFNIYTSKGNHNDTDKISYVYYEKDNKLAYLQAERFGGLKYSTVHRSERGSGFGSGFSMCDDAEVNLTIDELKKGFVLAPNWATGDITKITKYKGMEDYLKRPINNILTMYKIK